MGGTGREDSNLPRSFPTSDKAFKQDMIAFGGELIGTAMYELSFGVHLKPRLIAAGTCVANQIRFIFLGLGCIKTAQDSQTASQSQTATSLGNQTILFISCGMGLSLLITAWVRLGR